MEAGQSVVLESDDPIQNNKAPTPAENVEPAMVVPSSSRELLYYWRATMSARAIGSSTGATEALTEMVRSW